MKTKIGISAGVIAAAAYFIAAFDNFIPLLLIVGYILICEPGRWLKVSAVKALVIVIGFTLIGELIAFIPDLISFFNSFSDDTNIKQLEFVMGLTKVISIINTVLYLVEKVILLILGFFAVKGKSFNIGFIDNFITKHFPLETAAQ
jgi:hypothetical protein